MTRFQEGQRVEQWPLLPDQDKEVTHVFEEAIDGWRLNACGACDCTGCYGVPTSTIEEVNGTSSRELFNRRPWRPGT